MILWAMQPRPVQAVMDGLHAAHHAAYLVGGCVRDCLLGRVPRDHDIATDARPERVTSLFAKVIPTGIQYGTVTVLMDDMPIEVTTFRADGHYGDGRRPNSVTFSDQIEADLARRDFTINAMAWSPARGVVDPFGGEGDLKRNVLTSSPD